MCATQWPQPSVEYPGFDTMTVNGIQLFKEQDAQQ
jgi:hypothetical protein